jgi:hypothetical protein
MSTLLSALEPERPSQDTDGPSTGATRSGDLFGGSWFSFLRVSPTRHGRPRQRSQACSYSALFPQKLVQGGVASADLPGREQLLPTSPDLQTRLGQTFCEQNANAKAKAGTGTRLAPWCAVPRLVPCTRVASEKRVELSAVPGSVWSAERVAPGLKNWLLAS